MLPAIVIWAAIALILLVAVGVTAFLVLRASTGAPTARRAAELGFRAPEAAGAGRVMGLVVAGVMA